MRQEFIQHSEISNDKIICKEKGRTFHLHTGNASFAKVKIDGGVVTKNTSELRCDYLIIKQKIEDIEIFVELKGNDIKYAYKQIIASYNNYASKSENIKHYAVIVASYIPKTPTTLQKIKSEFKKKQIESLVISGILKVKYCGGKEIKKIN